jgi:arsenical pump membrane protein
MNNLPAGLAGGAALAKSPTAQPLAHALLIGVDLGPNLSVTGSLATILWLIALRREKVEITPWQFFKVGVVAMPAALCLSVLALWAFK